MVNIDTICPGCMNDTCGAKVCAVCGDGFSAQTHARALPLKTILNDRFLIGRVLGRPGGFGITYLAWDLSLQTTAAIKEFLPSCSVTREAGNTSVIPNSKEDQIAFSDGLGMFLQEARTLVQFSHPNIARIRDYFTANNTAYLVMEYHQGLSLDQYVKSLDYPVSEDRALEIILPVLDGLHAVHQKDFLHRDIKPQNIYLTRDAVPILLDFGSARFAVSHLTRTLTVMLTSGFAPFEQYHEKGRQGPWTDLYACAATLYFMTTRTVPADAIERQYTDNLIPPQKLNPNLSRAFSGALLKALEIEYTSRPQSVAEFRDLLLGTESIDRCSSDAITLLPSDAGIASKPTIGIGPSKSLQQTGSGTIYRSNNSTTKMRKINAGHLLVAVLIAFTGILVWDGPQQPSVEPSTKLEPIALEKTALESEPATNLRNPNVARQKPSSIHSTSNDRGGLSENPQISLQSPASNGLKNNPRPVTESKEGLSAVLASAQVDMNHTCHGSSINKPCRLDTAQGTAVGHCVRLPQGQLHCMPGLPPRNRHRHRVGLRKPFNR